MGDRLNKNNYLVWEVEHSFQPAPLIAQAIDDVASMVVNGISLLISPLLNDIAQNGINPTTLLITVQDNIVTPATWDSLTQKITYYPPAGILVGDTRIIKYKWQDNLGNFSNEATISIGITARPTGWRGYAPSRVCLLDGGGQNTGMAFYDDLEKYYTDDGSSYVPLTTKTNDPIDPDYIPPVQDLIMCPLPSQTDDFFIYNWHIIFPASNPQPRILSMVFNKNGGTVYNFPGLNHLAADPQPKIIQVPPGLYDSIEVTVENCLAGAASVEMFPGVGGSAPSSQLCAGGTETKTFINQTLGTDPYLILEV